MFRLSGHALAFTFLGIAFILSSLWRLSLFLPIVVSYLTPLTSAFFDKTYGDAGAAIGFYYVDVDFGDGHPRRRRTRHAELERHVPCARA